jgi:hypothetical protein
MTIKLVTLLILISTTIVSNSFAACGVTDRTWVGTTNSWGTASNWSGSDRPDTATENAIIVNTGVNARMNTNVTVGCVDVQSGIFQGDQNRTITVVGDYFQAPFANTLSITSGNFKIEMGGTGPQSFEAVDDVRDIILSNDSSVTFKNNFRIRSDLTITSTGITYVEGDITLNNANIQQQIPAGHTVVIKNGGSIFAKGGLNVSGVLKIEAGGELRLRRDETLNVASGGVLQLVGASGNPAKIVSEATGRSFVFTMNGNMTASNFTIQRTNASGLSVGATGTISSMDNGEFRGIAQNGFAISLANGASLPSTMDTIGFYNDDARTGVFNFSANAYSGGSITLDNYSGDVSGSGFEQDANNQIDWTSLAATELSIVDDSETNEPANFTDPGDEFTFAEFAFTLTQNDTATDITQIILTMTGTASISDFEYIRAYVDANNNCNYNASNDTLIGDLSFSGSPAKATINFTPGQVQTNGPSDQACFFIRAKASANPSDSKTMKFGVMSPSDVTNSQAYSFSTTSSPPLEGKMSTVRNANYSTWNGSTNNNWTEVNNWSGATPPTSTRDCQIGVGTNTTLINTSPVACANATLQTNGTINWNNSTFHFEVYNTLNIQSSFNFQNASLGSLVMKGSANQSLTSSTTFPGNLIIDNSGGASASTVSVLSNVVVSGNLTCADGRIAIPNGVTLSIGGNVTIQNGCEVDIQAGGTLALGNGRTLTVDTGGSLKIVGNSGSKATVTTTNAAYAMAVVVNGTINARHYTFDHLATSGVTINAGATINATNHLQDGSFTYPVNSSTTLLNLHRQIPTNTLTNMMFDTNGSGAGSVTNIDTNATAAGTLSITGHSGDLTGSGFDDATSYLISWSGETNTILLTRETSNPASVTVGGTYNMVRYGFQQASAGAYSDTDITSLKLTLNGTGTSSDISNIQVYYDNDCDGAGGGLIGSGTFSGNPASRTFTFSAGQLTVPADAVSPQKRCIFIYYTIASNATGNNTVGVSIASASDIVNSQGYALSASTPTPVTSGSPSSIYAPSTTIWTGSTNTDWNTASNWSAGVPSSTKTCQIPNAGNNPTISSGVASCQHVDITNGTLTLSGGATLETYGNFSNTGTFNQSGTLEIEDGGSSSNHNITSTSTLTNLHINKTGGGTIGVTDSSLQINSVVINNSNFLFKVYNARKLVLPNGINMSAGTFQLDGGGTIEIGNGQTLTLSGAIFLIAGANETFPQNSSTKGLIQPVGGSGTWGFNATSGRISFTGFHFSRMNTSGLVLGGSTEITQLRGGQFTNLSTSHSSVRAIQINTTGSIATSATNIAWTWGSFNTFTATGGTPSNGTSYNLIYSSGCSGQSMDFSGWTGDWYESEPTFDVSTKVSTSSCNISLSNSQSAVSLENFKATPYNGKVDISWTTVLESNHVGFNLYRSSSLNGNDFQQVNNEIIRNLKNAGQARGNYRFIDEDVTNDQFYYYFLEDLEVGGKRTLHGPVFATPKLALGAPPASGSDVNDGTNPDDGDDGGSASPTPIKNPSYKDLGNGIEILSQTSTNLVIKVTPSAPTYSVSAWDGSYEEISVTGYSNSLVAGSPELPEKEILIEVYQFATLASILNANVTQATVNSKKIVPASTFTQNGDGSLNEAKIITNAIYTTNSFAPNDFISVDNNLVTIGQKKYLRVKINPIKYNPVLEDLQVSSEIIAEISLDGNDWNTNPPSASHQENPYLVNNSLKIDIEKSGMHELNYSDLVNTYTSEPFENADTTTLRLYQGSKEIPLEIVSGDTVFNAGDKLRFYAKHSDSFESKTSSLILTQVDALNSSNSPLRVISFDGAPIDFSDSDEPITTYTKNFEQDLFYMDGLSVGHNEDHFMWKRMFSMAAWDTFSLSAQMNELLNSSDESVLVSFNLKGSIGQFHGNPMQHHLELSINGNLVDEVKFWSNDYQTVSFEIPSAYFLAGMNSISLQLLDTHVVNSDLDVLFIDSVKIDYVGNLMADSNYTGFKVNETLVKYTVDSFTNSSIVIYDTSVDQVSKIANANIQTLDAGTTYQATFGVDDYLNSDDQKEIFVLTEDAFITPVSLSLTAGAQEFLKDSSNRADLIIIGHSNLIYAASDLESLRRSQGLEVKSATTEQIYAEFSNGSISSRAIKDFINYARSNWEKAPRYVFIIGDATTDPLDHNIDTYSNADRTSDDIETIPMPLSVGRFQDYGNDNFFVEATNSHLPTIAIGRLPTNDPEDVKNYIQKIISFENGASSPSSISKVSFLAGQDDDFFDKFLEKSKQIQLSVNSHNTNLSTSMSDATALSTNAAIKSEIENLFEEAPLFLSLMGHGSTTSWGKSNAFTATDAKALTNSKHSISIMWSCEGAQYYSPEKSYKSIGEELVLNKDGGSVVYLGSTTFTTPTAQIKLAQSFFTQFSIETNKVYDDHRIGDIFLQSKLALGTNEYEKDIVGSFSLIGDPSVQLPSSIFAPPPAPVQVIPPAPQESGGGGGCSAFAASGNMTKIPWYYGLMEWAFYIGLIIAFTLGRKRKLKL